jgi:hypothetical protein
LQEGTFDTYAPVVAWSSIWLFSWFYPWCWNGKQYWLTSTMHSFRWCSRNQFGCTYLEAFAQ